MSQSINLSAAQYTLSFYQQAYVTTGATISLTASLNGTSVFTATTSTNAPSYSLVTTTVTGVAGANTLKFEFASTGLGQNTYILDDITLTFLRALSLAPALPSNTPPTVRNVTAAIDSFVSAGGTLTGGFAALGNLNSTQLVQAGAQLSGQPGASGTQSGLNATTQFINTVFDAASGNAGGQGIGGAIAYADEETLAYAKKLSPQAREAYAAVTPKDRVAANLPDGRWGVWAQVYGGNSRVSGDAGAGTNGTSSRVWGMAVGADYRVSPDARVGFALGGGSTSYGIDNGFGGGRSDMFQLGVYGRQNWGAAYLAGALSYAWQDNTTDRIVTIAGTDSLRASYRSNALTGRIESGWRFATPFVGIAPYGALQSTTFFLPSYGETAVAGSNQFALSYASRNVTATRGELGLRWDKAMIVQDGIFTWMARTAFANDWNRDRAATATFQSLGTSFTVNGASPAANSALVSLGGEWKSANGWSVFASYEGEYSRTTVSNGGKGTLRYEWR